MLPHSQYKCKKILGFFAKFQCTAFHIKEFNNNKFYLLLYNINSINIVVIDKNRTTWTILYGKDRSVFH